MKLFYDARQNEEGLITLLILMLLMMGTFFLVPGIGMANTALTSKGIQSDLLSEQFARDGATEFAAWNLIYGTASTTLNQQNTETEYTVNLNGETTTVDEDVDGLRGSRLVEGDLPEPRLAPRDRRVVGNVVVQAEECEQRTHEPFGLPGGQAEHHAEGDGRLDRLVRVHGLAAWLPSLRSRRIPVRELAVSDVEPDGQASAVTEACLVLTPVPHAVGLLDVLPLAALETGHEGPRLRWGRPILARELELRTKAAD